MLWLRSPLFRLIVCMPLLIGCSPSAPAQFSTIFGSLDFKFVNQELPSVFALQANPVEAPPGVQVPDLFKNPRPRCTAFFISSNLFMTAAHCKAFLQQARLNYQSTSEDWLTLVVADEFSQLTFLGQTTPSDVFPLSHADVAWHAPALDAMVVRWNHSPAKIFIRPCQEKAANHGPRNVKLWGFPNGLPLSESSGQLMRQVHHAGVTFLLHNVDSLPGESGGPLLQLTESSEHCVAAMHVRGAGQNIFSPGSLANSEQKSAAQYAQEACLGESENRRNECEKTFAFNKAMPIDAIAQQMRSDAPDLWREIFQRSAR